MFFLGKRRRKSLQNGIWKILMAGVLSLTLLAGNVVTLQAADFRHVHTDACYKQGMGPCNAKHQQSTRNTITTAHCTNCNASTTQTMYVNWDHCYGTGQDFELGGWRTCNQCGSRTYQWGGSSAGKHEIPQKVLSCGKSDAARGRLWVRNATPEWTTGEVTLEAGVQILESGFALHSEPYSWDGKTSWSGQTSIRAGENGSYNVYARAKDGSVVSESIRVENIDRTAPVLAGVKRSEETWTREDVVLTLTAKDLQPDGKEGCGLAEQAYSYDGGVSFTDETVMTVSGNGSYEVMLTDSLGNRGTVPVTVENIDKAAPDILDIVQIEEGWQPKSVTMQIQAEDQEGGAGLHAQSYSLDGENWQEGAEFLFTENGTYHAWVRDALENENGKEFVVNRIDCTPPVIEKLETSEKGIWEDKVFVTIQAKDLQPDGSEGCGLAEQAYSLDGGETWQTDNGFYVIQGKQYDIRVRDALLWESEERIITRKDFPYPPKEEMTPEPNPAPSPQQPQQPQEPDEEEQPKQEKRTDTEKHWQQKETDLHFTEETETMPEEKETIQQQELLAEKESPVQTLKRPWYATKAGKVLLVGAGTLAGAGVFGSLLVLYLFSLPVYWLDEKRTQKKLGRVLLHRGMEGYFIVLPDFMLETAKTAHYQIKVSAFLLKRLENARLLIESEEKSRELLIQETIDFVL